MEYNKIHTTVCLLAVCASCVQFTRQKALGLPHDIMLLLFSAIHSILAKYISLEEQRIKSLAWQLGGNLLDFLEIPTDATRKIKEAAYIFMSVFSVESGTKCKAIRI